MTQAHGSSTADAKPRSGSVLGSILCRVIVPAWVLAGAAYKLWDRNPNVLPKPIRDTVIALSRTFGIDDLAAFLTFTMRALIFTELALVVTMFLLPRLARAAAMFTLTVFVSILICVLTQQALKDGLGAIVSGSCGCFGEKGPPPSVVLLIDAGMLLGVAMFRPRAGGAANSGRVFTWLVALAASAALAFGVPEKSIALPAPDGGGAGQGAAATGANDGKGAGNAGSGAARAADPEPPAATGAKWPDAPALNGLYFEDFETKWLTTRLDSQPLALQITRPLPAGVQKGVWHVLFYRGDCDHCHDLMEHHIAGKPAEARTIAVRVPDTDPGADLPMPLTKAHLHALPSKDGLPNYVFTTPVLLTVVDGVVAAICTDPEDDALVEETLATDAAGPAAPTAPAAPPAASPAAPPPPAPPTNAAAAPAWPAAPALKNLYVEDFDTKWVGSRLDGQPLALQISRPLPADVNTGVWHVLFYRADCDHCHELMELYLAGQPAERRTIAVRIPDTDPGADLPMPLTVASMHTLPGSPSGPDYVIQTPILLTVVDGVVKAIATDPEDSASVEACLKAK